ncbi:MAG TPA: flagellar biosynthetic protein FliR [Gammaproteobacteria bacterium]|nr:flagellar biosynthetic protein FliR [bacterium BMS3Abin12]HDK03625.1 flagellar biosynthetic protein FliR [Gammaproteobacteria bacterium]HDO33590.1 flagellar biosynthetic protein FliR [Chromatiales bacterium]
MLTFTTGQIDGWVGSGLWPLMRIGAMLAVAPIFAGRMISVRIRTILALAITWVLVPIIPPAPAIDPLSAQGLLISVQQLAIGVAMGFVVQLVFGAVVVAGQSIAVGMGLGFSEVVDPLNGVQVPVLSQFYSITATLLFLALNGHLLLIQVLAASFHALPVGPVGLSRADLWRLAGWGSQMFAGAIAIALPALLSLILVNLAFGMVTKAAPQMNIFAVGFPVTILVGFVLILVTLPALGDQFQSISSSAFVLLSRLFGVGG